MPDAAETPLCSAAQPMCDTCDACDSVFKKSHMKGINEKFSTSLSQLSRVSHSNSKSRRATR